MSVRKSALAAVAVLGLLASSAAAQEWKVLFATKDDFAKNWDTWLGKPHKSAEVADLKKNEKGEYTGPIGLNKDPLGVYTVVEVDGAPAIKITGQVFGAITTKEEFENYHLSFEVKWGEKKWPPREGAVRDSGLLYHCVGPDGAGSGFWKKSFESQIQENDFGDFYSVAGVIVDVEGEFKMVKRVDPKTKQEREVKGGLTYKKGGEKVTGWTGRIIRNPLSEKKHGEWNTVELYAVGQTAVHVNNGVANMVMTGLRHKVDGKEVPLTKGSIQLQSEGAEVYYRNIKIRPIKEIPAEVFPK